MKTRKERTVVTYSGRLFQMRALADVVTGNDQSPDSALRVQWTTIDVDDAAVRSMGQAFKSTGRSPSRLSPPGGMRRL